MISKEKIISSINKKIPEILFSADSSEEAMIASFVANSGGKRYRALLHYLVGSLLDVPHERLISVGSICEIIHIATLLHDDVIDNSHLRRRTRSANQQWGNKKCILTGDFLLARGLRELVKININPLYLLFSSTIEDLVSGEILEMSANKKLFLPEDDYFKIIRCKTASLFCCSVKSAAILNSRDEDSFAVFGYSLGQLFQMRDDFIDYYCDSTESGKARFSDLKNFTITLPLIRLVKKASNHELEFLVNLMNQEEVSDSDCTNVFQMMERHHIGEEITSIICELTQNANQFMDRFPKSPIKSEIVNLTNELIITNEMSNIFSKISN